NLENYAVEALADGFRLVPAAGGLSTTAGEFGALTIDYRVAGETGIQIEGTMLSFGAMATGEGALATTHQDYFDDASEELDVADVMVTGGGGSITSDAFMLPEVMDSLEVDATFMVNVPLDASDASIAWVDQEFVTVPEPGSTLLALTALLSLGALNRIRRS
ncbi:MAG: hypothetical protein AAEJ52_21270, partial [Myxococcota bacterium]